MTRPLLHLFALLWLAAAGPPANAEIARLVEGGAAFSPLAAAVVGETVVMAGVGGGVMRVDLSSGARAALPIPAPISWVADAGDGTFLAITTDGSFLYRVHLDGSVAEKSRTPRPLLAALPTPGGLVAAVATAEPGQPLLWRGRLEGLVAWRLKARKPSLPPLLAAVADTVALATDGSVTAVVWPFFRSELALVDGAGEARLHPLPYFAEAWAPLSTAGADPAAWPKPYASVAVGGGRAWCLSFQEGPWAEDPVARRRGRHLVEVALDGRLVAQHRLSTDMYQVVYDHQRRRVLLLDRGGGVWTATFSPAER